MFVFDQRSAVAMDKEYVENVTASLVREYLSRKGLKMTLEVMEEELPRGEGSISNRMHLRKVLHIDKIMSKNKESEAPLKAMLEVIAKSLIDRAHNRAGSAVPDSARGLTTETVRGDDPSLSSSLNGRSTPSLYKSPSTSDYRDPPVKPHTKTARGADSSDLVIDDDVEGETLLGDGRAGLLAPRVSTAHTRPTPATTKLRGRGLSGPIASNTEDRDARSRMARIKSSRAGSARKKREPEPKEEDPSPTRETSEPTLESRLGLREGRTASSGSHIGSYSNGPSLNAAKNTESPPLSLKDPVPNTSHSRIQSDPIQDVLREDSGSWRSGLSRLTREVSRDGEDGDKQLTSDSDSRSTDSSSSLRGRSAHWRKKDDTLNQYGVSKSCIVSEMTPKPVNFLDAVNNTKPKAAKFGDIEFGDIDDLDADVAKLDLRPRKPLMNPTMITDCRPIDIQTAMELKKLCLGSASNSFNDEWAEQGFTFCEYPKLTYGIVQKKGGPCGLLAAVQACMLQQLLFCLKPPRRESSASERFDLDPEVRSEALALGLADIFWRAGEEERAVVTIPSGRSIFNGNGRYRPDNLTETLVLNHFKTYEDLSSFMKDHVQLFEDEGQPGVVLTLYSAVLSRTVQKVRDDMDDREGRLMGQHFYCTQELVNLILTGQAASNTFNDYILLDGMKLRGVAKRSSVGFMSLFEHYKSCEVGTYYKTPKYPIWVVCSESHFSVLFCLRKELISDWRVERRFDLYYYDGLANQDEEIRLTVVTSNKHYRPPADEDLIPPLELCIRTKWAEAEIDWNGTEPLL